MTEPLRISTDPHSVRQGESIVRTTDEPQPLNGETENSGVSSNDHESDLANHSIENSGYVNIILSDFQQRI